MRPSRLKMMAFCPEHPKWDQHPKFTPLSEMMSIRTTFIRGVPPHPPWGMTHSRPKDPMTQPVPPYREVFHRLSVSFSFVFLNGWHFVMPPPVWIPDSVLLPTSGYKYFWLVENLRNQSEEVYPNLSGDVSSVWNFCACSLVIFFGAKPVFVLQNVGCFLRLACFLLNKNWFNSSYFGMILIDSLMMPFQKLQIE